VVGVLADEIAVSPEHVCARVEKGALKCWGDDSSGQLGSGRAMTNGPSDIVSDKVPKLVVGLTNAVELAVGAYHTCARKGDGTVWCWGLGRGSVPLDEKVGTATQLAMGRWSSCALLTDRRVRCAGAIDESASPKDPYEVEFGGKPVQIAGGSHHLCALLDTGHVECVGENKSGQLGDATNENAKKPVRVVWRE
jgi:alpha-tubulin suppressor-like RCC1 family protein